MIWRIPIILREVLVAVLASIHVIEKSRKAKLKSLLNHQCSVNSNEFRNKNLKRTKRGLRTNR